MKVRIVPYSEIESCPDKRLDAQHYIPRHKTAQHRDETDHVNALCRKHKAALTRAKNSGDPQKIIKACDAALEEFERTGLWPDQWALWETARLDALLQTRR